MNSDDDARRVRWDDPEVDWDRFEVELRRQIDEQTMPELLTPGLLAEDTGEGIVVYEKREPGHDVDLANAGARLAFIPTTSPPGDRPFPPREGEPRPLPLAGRPRRFST